METVPSSVHTRERNQDSLVLSDFSYVSIHETLDQIETLGKPKSINELTRSWDKLMERNMRYDAVNYAMSRSFDTEEDKGTWVEKINESKIGLSIRQLHVFKNTLSRLKDDVSDQIIQEGVLKLLSAITPEPDYPKIITIFSEYPSLQRYFSNDEVFWKQWSDLYRSQDFATRLQEGIGNCKTFAIMSKMVFMMGSVRWNLGIQKITYTEQSDGHVLLHMHSRNGIITYDAIKSLYKTTQ